MLANEALARNNLKEKGPGSSSPGANLHPICTLALYQGGLILDNLLKSLEAATGFEPVNNGFADRCLTSWLCRLKKKWSGKRDSNPRLQPWQGCTLPLSYSRSETFFVKNSPLVKGKKPFSVFRFRFSLS